MLRKKGKKNPKETRKDKGKKRRSYNTRKSYHIINMETGKVVRSGVSNWESINDMIQDDFGEETYTDFYGTDNQARLQGKREKRLSQEAMAEKESQSIPVARKPPKVLITRMAEIKESKESQSVPITRKTPKVFISRPSVIQYEGSTEELANVLDLHESRMHVNNGKGDLEEIRSIQDIPENVRNAKWNFTGTMETISGGTRYYGYRWEATSDIYPVKIMSRVDRTRRMEDLEIAGDFEWSDYYFGDAGLDKNINDYHKKAERYIKRYFPNAKVKFVTEEAD